MDTPRWAVAGFLLVLSSACAGAGSGGATPGPSDGPAFQMVVLREVPCPKAVDANICLRVKVSNFGNESGPGACHLRTTSDAGEEMDIPSGELPIAGLEPGSDLVAILGWTRPVPDAADFVGFCEPSLRS
jgi:hypothetical protein